MRIMVVVMAMTSVVWAAPTPWPTARARPTVESPTLTPSPTGDPGSPGSSDVTPTLSSPSQTAPQQFGGAGGGAFNICGVVAGIWCVGVLLVIAFAIGLVFLIIWMVKRATNPTITIRYAPPEGQAGPPPGMPLIPPAQGGQYVPPPSPPGANQPPQLPPG